MRFPGAGVGGALVLALGGLCAGCGDSEMPMGSVQLSLASLPAGEYKELRLDLQRVDGLASATAGDAGWLILGTPNRVVHLDRQDRKIDAPLPAQRSVPVGQYDALRLIFGPKSTILLADGREHALSVPLALGSGLQLASDFSVLEDHMAESGVHFEGAKVMLTPQGDAVTYSLAPIAEEAKKATIGSISGRITDQATGQGIVGVALFAEELDASGRATIVRTAVSSTDGCYTLTMLPINRSYYVVSRPYVNGIFYAPHSSGALTLSSRSAQVRYNTALTLNQGLGALSGEITPMAASNQSDQVNLLRQFEIAGAVTPWLIVDTTIAQSFANETYWFASVPPGTYAVGAVRSTVYLDGSIQATATTQSASFMISANTGTNANIQYP